MLKLNIAFILVLMSMCAAPPGYADVALDESITAPVRDPVDTTWQESPSPLQITRRSTESSSAPEIREVISAGPGGALHDIVVFCSGGHGFTGDGGGWTTGRGLTHGVVEDMGNIDQLNLFAEYCFRAGATVVPMRPIGFQPREVVMDNDHPGVTYGGMWSDSASAVYYGAPGALPYRYASVSTNGTTAWATYRPVIPVAGFYPVYTWVRSGSDRVRQLYRIRHSGGLDDVRVHHRRVGLGWVWLGNYHFDAGTNGYVMISNWAPDETAAGRVVIADAIRFGNGMGDVDRGAGVSGFERELEASRYWIQRMTGQGMSASLYDLSGYNDASDNVGAPARMAAEMNRAEDGSFWDRIYIGFHSNADGGAGTARGAMGLFDNRGTTAKIDRQRDLGLLMARYLNEQLEWADSGVLLADDWSNNSADLLGSAYGELYGAINDEMNSTIIEVAFHNNATDALFLKDPLARAMMAQASVQSVIAHLATNQPSIPLVFPPAPPHMVRAEQEGAGRVRISWSGPATNQINPHAATGYRIEQSPNGYGFGDPSPVAGGSSTSAVLTNLAAGSTWYFRVAATNRGGLSPPSAVVGVRLAPHGRPPYLVVNGFQRFERNQVPTRFFTNNINGAVAMVRPRSINSFDYVVPHGQAIAAAGQSFASCDQSAVAGGAIDLREYHGAVWMLGEESTVHETFNAAEQSAVSAFLEGGGNLFVSGAEIAWDLDYKGTAADRTFFTNYLRAGYVSDASGTYLATGTAGGLWAGTGTLMFDQGTGATYQVGTADVLAPRGGASVAMVYGSSPAGTAIAGVQYSNRWRSVVLGFPFETIHSADQRSNMMRRTIAFFGRAPHDEASITLDEPFASRAAGTTIHSLSGGNNAAVTGAVSWLNQSSGVSGTWPAGPAWTIPVPVQTGTNVVVVQAVNHLGDHQVSATAVVVVAAAAGQTGPVYLVNDDFESAGMGNWVADTAGAWAVGTAGPINGGYSMQHQGYGAGATNYVYQTLTGDVAQARTTWRLVLRNGNVDPSGNNRFHFFLGADDQRLAGAEVDGYAVGVNASGTDDRLRIWRVRGGRAEAVVVSSSLDWNAGMTVAIEVIRTASGRWDMRYQVGGSFNGMTPAGSGFDDTFTDLRYMGLVVYCTSSQAGTMRMDDVTIVQDTAPDIRPDASFLSVPNQVGAVSLTGRAWLATGHLVWTNEGAGAGGRHPAGSNWVVVADGLRAGENLIRVTVSNHHGQAASCDVAVSRSAYALGHAWHRADEAWVGGSTMREPAVPLPAQAVNITCGSQSGGSGNAAVLTGGILYHRSSSGAPWQALPMSPAATQGSNVFWRAVIPAGQYAAGDAVWYYMALTYADRATTYVAASPGGGDSQVYALESEAMQHAVRFVYGNDYYAPLLLDEPFEPGQLAAWSQTPAGAWTNATATPIAGAGSLQHRASGIAGTSTIFKATGFDVAADRTIWRFILRNGSFDPSSGNRFHVVLAADRTNGVSGAMNGYAVGVNLAGSDDLLKVWRVTGGQAAATVVSSTLDWNSSMTVAIEVSRETDGTWELRHATSGSFDHLVSAGRGTDGVYTTCAGMGLVFVHTASNAGKLSWDALRVWQERRPTIRLAEDVLNVAYHATSCTLSGTSRHAEGHLAWSNRTGGRGVFAVSSNWTIDVTGILPGENWVYVTASNRIGQRAEATALVARSSFLLADAWHDPAAAGPGIEGMRTPLEPLSSEGVEVYSASRYAAGGNMSQQTGAWVHYRRQGAPAWERLAMAPYRIDDAHVYWRGVLPGGIAVASERVEYAFELAFADRETTWVGAANQGVSSVYGSSGEALARPFMFTCGPADPVVFEEDFESGLGSRWTTDTVGAWVTASSNPVAGAYSLKHHLSNLAATNYLAAAVSCRLSANHVAWRCVLRNGNFDPSANNRFHVMLTADRTDLRGPVNGYALGVNIKGSDDVLKLWRISNGTADVVVASSSLDWNASMTVTIEARRTPEGQWSLYHGPGAAPDVLVPAGSGSDSRHLDVRAFGIQYLCTATHAGKFHVDDIRIAYAWPLETGSPMPMHVAGASTVRDDEGIVRSPAGHDAGSRADATTRYVIAGHHAPVAPYTSWESAAPDIQTAVDAALPGDTVLVAPGVYDQGVRVSEDGQSNRLIIAEGVVVAATGTATNTVLLGGNGVRCVLLEPGAELHGFTLTGADNAGGARAIDDSAVLSSCIVRGNSAAYGGGVSGGTLIGCRIETNSADEGGGAYYSTLIECDVNGNTADVGGGIMGGAAWRTRIRGNQAAEQGGGAAEAVLYSCLVVGNTASAGGGIYDVRAVNATVAGNQAAWGGGMLGGTAVNSIVYFNQADVQGSNWWAVSAMSYTCSSPVPPGDANRDEDPQFIDLASLNLRVWPFSPLVDAGTHPDGIAGDRDLDGAARVRGVHVDIGAYEYQPPEPRMIVANGAGAPIEHDEPARADNGTLFAARVGRPHHLALTIANPGDAVLTINHWEWLDNPGAAFALFNEPAHVYPGQPMTFSMICTPAASGTYQGRLAVWHDGIDRPNPLIIRLAGDASLPQARFVIAGHSGAMPPYTNMSTAAATIQDAVNASLAGDTIWVAPGWYATGGMGLTGDASNRVAVLQPLVLRSTHGPDVTFIAGGEDVRCVYLAGGAVLDGFTLTNGINYGGVVCADRSALVTNCVISGNSASYGGGIRGGTFRNGIISGNSALVGGGAFDVDVSHALIADNEAVSLGGGGHDSTIVNSVVAFNRSRQGGGSSGGVLIHATVYGNTAGEDGAGVWGGVQRNCIIQGNQRITDGADSNWDPADCDMVHSCSVPLPPGTGNIAAAPGFRNADGRDFRLRADSPVIDQGGVYDQAGMTDLDGLPRITHGGADMGAYEYQGPAAAWLSAHGLPLDGAADGIDHDGDGMMTGHEWRSRTNPVDPLSRLAILHLAGNGSHGPGVRLEWSSATGLTYAVQRSVDLRGHDTFTTIRTGIAGSNGLAWIEDHGATNDASSYYYRIAVEE